MMHKTKRRLAYMLGMSYLSTCIVPIQAETVAKVDTWAAKEVYEATASGIAPGDWETTIQQTINPTQLKTVREGLEGNIEALGIVKTSELSAYRDVETTRLGVLTYYYEVLGQYAPAFDLKTGMLDYMFANKIVAGDDTGNIEPNKACTVQEAILFANRILEGIYTQKDAGAKGYLWEVTHEDNTIYLLGSVHIGEENLYPLNERLNTLIEKVDKVAFEVDFSDVRGYLYLVQKQHYLDGTTLKDHIEPTLYQEVVEAMAKFDMPESEVMGYKPWALSNKLTALSANQEVTEEVAETKVQLPIIDQYVYELSLLSHKEIVELEGYKFQADLFDMMPMTLQIEQLQDSLEMAQYPEERQEAIDVPLTEIWVDGFIEGDISVLEENYPKDTLLLAEDELMSLLYTERDQQMLAKIETYLNEEGSDDYLVVVGAGHMIGKEGIVAQLQAKGYDVKPL